MRRRSQGPVLAVTTRECSWQPDRGSLSAVREMSDEALQMLAFVKLMTKDDLPLPHGRRVQPADRGTFGLGRHPRAVRRGRMVRPSRIFLPCSLVHPAPTVEHSCACRGWSFPTGGRHGGGGQSSLRSRRALRASGHSPWEGAEAIVPLFSVAESFGLRRFIAMARTSPKSTSADAVCQSALSSSLTGMSLIPVLN